MKNSPLISPRMTVDALRKGVKTRAQLTLGISFFVDTDLFATVPTNRLKERLEGGKSNIPWGKERVSENEKDSNDVPHKYIFFPFAFAPLSVDISGNSVSLPDHFSKRAKADISFYISKLKQLVKNLRQNPPHNIAQITYTEDVSLTTQK